MQTNVLHGQQSDFRGGLLVKVVRLGFENSAEAMFRTGIGNSHSSITSTFGDGIINDVE